MILTDILHSIKVKMTMVFISISSWQEVVQSEKVPANRRYSFGLCGLDAGCRAYSAADDVNSQVISFHNIELGRKTILCSTKQAAQQHLQHNRDSVDLLVD